MAKVRTVAGCEGEPMPNGSGGDQETHPARTGISPRLTNNVGKEAVELGHLGVER